MKRCKYCGKMCEDQVEVCSCNSQEFETADELDAEKQKQLDWEKKMQEIRDRHKKRVLWTSTIAVALAAIIVATVLISNNADYNRVIMVNGVAQASKKEMDDAYEMSVAYMNQGDLANAIQQFGLIDERSGKYRDAQVRLIECNAQYRDQALAIADTYMQNGDYATALEKVNAVFASSPNDSVISAKRDEILAQQIAYTNSTRESIISKAQESWQQNDMSSAIAILKDGLVKLPNDAELQAALDSANATYKADFVNRIETLIAAGNNTDASALLQTALQIFPNDSELLAKTTVLQTSNVLSEATTKEMQGDLAGAITLLRNADSSMQQNATVIETLNRLEANYKQQVIAEAASLYDSDGYLVAAQKVQEGIDTLPDDTELITAKEQYISRAPVNLLSMDYLSKSSGYIYVTQYGAQDNLGNDYDQMLGGTGMSSNEDITYKIYGNYKKLTGIAFLTYDGRSSKSSNSVTIYGDEVLLYSSIDFSAGSDPQPFEINISGVDKLRFYFNGQRCGVSNVMLYK